MRKRCSNGRASRLRVSRSRSPWNSSTLCRATRRARCYIAYCASIMRDAESFEEVNVSESKSAGPLSGLTVIEICQALAGPYCCMMLSDMGARVIKVEKPGGDDSRGMPPHSVKGTSTYFMSINRGKESIVLDLKTAAAREVLLKLVAKADIVVENNRPGVLDRLGLTFEVFKAANPKIVLCSISGFGQGGPYRDLPA